MIEIICDFCGDRIETLDDQTNLQFCGTGRGPLVGYQLHAKCAKDVKSRLDNMMVISEGKRDR